MRGLPALISMLLAAAAAPFAMADARSTQHTETVDTLVARASAYVTSYQEDLTSVVADEIYTQKITAQIPRDKGMAPTRTLRGEIFFMFAPGHDWMAIRDVIQMDGRPASERLDLKEALRTLPAWQVADTFKAHNSRYNLGYVSRNFNEPTLSLLVLDARHRSRFAFEWRRTERVGGEPRVTLAFTERRPPTLIVNPKLQPVYSTGEITIEPGSGRVTRALLAATIDPLQIALTTIYGKDRKLGIWVPVRFSEHYRDGSPSGPKNKIQYEEIVCEARYTNFRQFIVKTSIR